MPAAATVVSFNDALLRTADVQLLDSGQWLNDNVVQYVIERFNANQRARKNRNYNANLERRGLQAQQRLL